MNLEKCIPKDKHDLAAIDRARHLGFPTLNPVFQSLLEWLQDANWPVAAPTAELLATAGPEMSVHIQSVLTSDDSVWKYWIIELLADKWSPEMWEMLRPSIERVADTPSQNDRAEEADIVAQAALHYHGNSSPNDK